MYAEREGNEKWRNEIFEWSKCNKKKRGNRGNLEKNKFGGKNEYNEREGKCKW